MSEESKTGLCTRCGKLLFGGEIPTDIREKDVCMCMEEKHDCQFIATDTINRGGIMGIIATCAICGETREVLSNGKILIVNKAWQTIKT